ncbi:MAG: hypothetical protein AAGJ80_12365, partial [Cyanobacteria bacterium J06553_1]
MKPTVPNRYDGARDAMQVETWLFQMEHYMVQDADHRQAPPPTDAQKVSYAGGQLEKEAALWWFSLAATQQLPATWEEFTAQIRREFKPVDGVRQARQQLRHCRQTHTVSEYVAKLRSYRLQIPDMVDAELLDRFVEGLRRNLQLEVMRSGVSSFDEAARVAVAMEQAFNGWQPHPQSKSSAPSIDMTAITEGEQVIPMEIGAVSKQSSKPYVQCYGCGRMGHIKKQCPDQRDQRSSHVKDNSKSGTVYIGAVSMATSVVPTTHTQSREQGAAKRMQVEGLTKELRAVKETATADAKRAEEREALHERVLGELTDELAATTFALTNLRNEKAAHEVQNLTRLKSLEDQLHSAKDSMEKMQRESEEVEAVAKAEREAL